MFNIDSSEFLLVAIVALVVIATVYTGHIKLLPLLVAALWLLALKDRL